MELTVCFRLGIRAEGTYFGLLVPGKCPARWLDLRRPVLRQLGGWATLLVLS